MHVRHSRRTIRVLLGSLEMSVSREPSPSQWGHFVPRSGDVSASFGSNGSGTAYAGRSLGVVIADAVAPPAAAPRTAPNST